MSDDNVIALHQPPEEPTEERARKVLAVAQNLASPHRPEVEAMFLVPEMATKLGIPPKQLTDMVKGIIAKREREAKRAADEERRRVERQEREAKREREKQQREAEKATEARRRAKEKDKADTFKRLVALPRAEQERGLAELAERIEADEEFLSEEFFQTVAPPPPSCAVEIEPWDEPVNVKDLLPDVIVQLRRYVVVEDHQALAIALWILFAWCHEIAVHSPLLVVTSPEQDSGKTTLVNVIGLLVPRPLPLLEASAASVYSLIDAIAPTILHDEADTILERKTDLRHIILGGWTKGATIPRKLGKTTYLFKIFCPKVIGLKFKDGRLVLPETAVSRSIIIKVKPRLATETVENFTNTDDDTFLTLRRKILRWATDSMQLLKDAKPEFPDGFINRLQENWKLPLAIAESAGQAKPARLAAIKLSGQRITEPSEGIRYLTAIRPLLTGRDEITSEEICAALSANPDEEFGTVSQKKLSLILGQYDIKTIGGIHPTKRSDVTRHGYRAAAFADAFARYRIPAPPSPPSAKRKLNRR